MKQYSKILFFVLVFLILPGCTMPHENVVNNVTINNAVSHGSGSVLTDQQIEKLQYLAQEEKLARDVYLQMYKIRSNRKFYNIINAEENHRAQVAGLLVAYGINNPIQDKGPGEFPDGEFTELYSQLIRSGSVSLAGALQVGADIETMDIKDIELMMPLFSNRADIQQVLNVLLEGSKRHLAAFSK